MKKSHQDQSNQSLSGLLFVCLMGQIRKCTENHKARHWGYACAHVILWAPLHMEEARKEIAFYVHVLPHS